MRNNLDHNQPHKPKFERGLEKLEKAMLQHEKEKEKLRQETLLSATQALNEVSLDEARTRNMLYESFTSEKMAIPTNGYDFINQADVIQKPSANRNSLFAAASSAATVIATPIKWILGYK